MDMFCYNSPMENIDITKKRKYTSEQIVKIKAAHDKAATLDKTIMKLPSEVKKKQVKSKRSKNWHRTQRYKISKAFKNGHGRYS